MRQRFAVALALGMALLGATVTGMSFAQTSQSATALKQSLAAQVQSDAYGRWDRDDRDGWNQRRGGWGRTDLEGSWEATNRSRGRGGMRGGFLPQFLRIDQSRHVVRILDARNRVIQEIAISGRYSSRGDFRDHSIGEWRGSKLVVQRTGPRGRQIVQTFALQNRGRTLVVNTRQESRNSRRAVEFEQVYHRA